MKFVYQIGQVPLYGALVNDVSLDEKRSWTVRETEYQQTGGRHVHTPAGRRIPSPTPITIQGSLATTGAQHFLFTSNRLRGIGGFNNVPLIVFETFDQVNVRWLYANGSITDIEESSQYGAELTGLYLRDISIQMTIDHTWRPLLPSYWEHRAMSNYTQYPTAQAGIDNLFTHVTTQDAIFARRDRGYYFQQWDNSLSEYAPLTWPLLYHGDGYGEDYADFRTTYVLIPEQMWPGQANAIYAFTGLSTQGIVTIQVNDFVSTLDLSVLSAQMEARGLGTLQKSDEVFVGQTSPFPSFIRRADGSVTANFIPKWATTGLYPGSVNPGLNKIILSGTGTTGRAAINIEYGAL